MTCPSNDVRWFNDETGDDDDPMARLVRIQERERPFNQEKDASENRAQAHLNPKKGQ